MLKIARDENLLKTEDADISLKRRFKAWMDEKVEMLDLTPEYGRKIADGLTLTRAAINIGVAGAFASGNWGLGTLGLSVGMFTDIIDGAIIRGSGADANEGWYKDFWADLCTGANIIFLIALNTKF